MIATHRPPQRSWLRRTAANGLVRLRRPPVPAEQDGWQPVARFSCPCGTSELPVTGTLSLPQHALLQGLAYLPDGTVAVSCGGYETSQLLIVDATGRALARRKLPWDVFAEDLAVAGNTLFLLTYENEKLLVWDTATLHARGERPYAGEGWGLGHDASGFWMTDGSATVTRRATADFAVTGSLQVSAAGVAVTGLNALAIGDGWGVANVFTTRRLVFFDLAGGAVLATLSATGLMSPGLWTALGPQAFTNGVALTPDGGGMLVGGKLWPRAFLLPLPPCLRAEHVSGS